MDKTSAEQKLEKTLEQIRKVTKFRPEVALVLGSGLGDFADRMDYAREIPYDEIEGFPRSTVEGHAGKFVLGCLGQIPVVCMKERIHYYEGYSISDVCLPVRLMRLMGAKTLFLTNAAGGLNESFQAGDLMMIKDHVSLFVPNPLIGPNASSLGVRFPDMTNVYDKGLQEILRSTAQKFDIPLREGVYTQLTGPSYESPAEIKMLRALGTDAVGMSTVVEAIAANHAGMKICGISCISNLAAGMSGKPLNHKEVQEAADAASKKFSKLVYESIQKMGGKAHDKRV